MKGQIFPDPLGIVTEALRGLLSASAAPEAQGATVGTKTPEGAFTPALPYVQVSHDGSANALGVVEDTTIRVAVFHRSDALGLALAQICRALLLDYRAASLRTILPLTGPFPTEDPASGAPLTYLTLSVRTRPIST